MVELGRVQEPEIIRKKDFGVYLTEEERDGAAVLLPEGQIPEGAGAGDKVEVFIHKDSLDRLIATAGKPKLQVGETAKLEVKDVAKIETLLDMGLEEDLLLPFKEQTRPVRKGEQCLVTPYMDKSKRLAATMHAYSHMSNQPPYKAENWVTGIVHEINKTAGAFVAVDHRYYGFVLKKESYDRFRGGDTTRARVTRMRGDGKLGLCVREKSYVQVGTDAEKALKVMGQFDGVLPFNDEAKPEAVTHEFSMSENTLRRVVGRLLEEGKIRTTDKIIERV